MIFECSTYFHRVVRHQIDPEATRFEIKVRREWDELGKTTVLPNGGGKDTPFKRNCFGINGHQTSFLSLRI